MANYFLTGGAGFLGRAFIHALGQYHQVGDRVTVYSRDEGKHARCRRLFPYVNYVLGDVRDLSHLTAAMAGHDIVIHMAAMKYVPQGETNVRECISVNIQGSANVASAAMANGVERVVGISTDKACEPVNVYGMTKQLMERLFQEANRYGGTQFNTVRYGNVVSSTGSVIPMFIEQVKQGQVIITDPVMTRFWLSVGDAVRLIFDALDQRAGGNVIVPRLPALCMGNAALAVAACVRETYPGVMEPEYITLGPRFGEKVDETLIAAHELPWASIGDSHAPYGLPWPTVHIWGPGTNMDWITGEYPGITSLYTSDNPDHVLTYQEFQAMITEAME